MAPAPQPTNRWSTPLPDLTGAHRPRHRSERRGGSRDRPSTRRSRRRAAHAGAQSRQGRERRSPASVRVHRARTNRPARPRPRVARVDRRPREDAHERGAPDRRARRERRNRQPGRPGAPHQPRMASNSTSRRTSSGMPRSSPASFPSCAQDALASRCSAASRPITTGWISTTSRSSAGTPPCAPTPRRRSRSGCSGWSCTGDSTRGALGSSRRTVPSRRRTDQHRPRRAAREGSTLDPREQIADRSWTVRAERRRRRPAGSSRRDGSGCRRRGVLRTVVVHAPRGTTAVAAPLPEFRRPRGRGTGVAAARRPAAGAVRRSCGRLISRTPARADVRRWAVGERDVDLHLGGEALEIRPHGVEIDGCRHPGHDRRLEQAATRHRGIPRVGRQMVDADRRVRAAPTEISRTMPGWSLPSTPKVT